MPLERCQLVLRYPCYRGATIAAAFPIQLGRVSSDRADRSAARRFCYENRFKDFGRGPRGRLDTIGRLEFGAGAGAV